MYKVEVKSTVIQQIMPIKSNADRRPLLKAKTSKSPLRTIKENSAKSYEHLHPFWVSLNCASATLRTAFIALYATSGLDLIVWGVGFAFVTKLARGFILKYGGALDYSGYLCLLNVATFCCDYENIILALPMMFDRNS